MATVFTRIINGELPGRFVWADADCVAFLTVSPLTDSHALVVPREEVEQWTELSAPAAARLIEVARLVGRAQQAEWQAPRIGLLAQGFEVPHVHLHVWPAWGTGDFDLSNAQDDPSPAALDEAAARLRARLREQLAGSAEAGHVASAR